MKYHFNPESGKTRVCHASLRVCPLVHGDSPDKARMNYENKMSDNTLKTMKKTLSRVDLMNLPKEWLSNIPLKELDSAQLIQTLRHESIKIGFDSEVIDSSIDLATILHAHQTRSNRGNFTNTPYIEHPLRNATRLIRLGVKDQDVVIAAVLHDTIEDGAFSFVKKFTQEKNIDEPNARKILSEYIEKTYGERVLGLVDAVTNNYIADTDKKNMSLETKNSIYKNHVEKNISSNPAVFLVKVSDFIDNATGLYHNDIPGREQKTLKQATKYLPVVDVFLKEMNNVDLKISDNGLLTIRKQLNSTSERLKTIIEKYSH